MEKIVDDRFSILSPFFFERAQRGLVDSEINLSADKWFLKALALEARALAGTFCCTCKVSEVEIETARQCWLRDVGVLDIDGDEKKLNTPDHFKQAGILAYWLRRRLPLREVEQLGRFDTDEGRYRQKVFLGMPSELMAFILGYNLCKYIVLKTKIDNEEDISVHLRTMTPDFKFAHDVCVLMKTKHISPHSLMMIYRSMFLHIRSF